MGLSPEKRDEMAKFVLAGAGVADAPAAPAKPEAAEEVSADSLVDEAPAEAEAVKEQDAAEEQTEQSEEASDEAAGEQSEDAETEEGPEEAEEAEPAAESEEAPAADDAEAANPPPATPGKSAPGGFKGTIKHNGAVVNLDLDAEQHAAMLQKGFNYDSLVAGQDKRVAALKDEEVNNYFVRAGILRRQDPKNPKSSLMPDSPEKALAWLEKMHGKGVLEEAALRYAGYERPDPLKDAIAEIDAELKTLDPEIPDDEMRMRTLRRQKVGLEEQIRTREDNRRVAETRGRLEAEQKQRDEEKAQSAKLEAVARIRDEAIGASPFGKRIKTMEAAITDEKKRAQFRGRVLENVTTEAVRLWKESGGEDSPAAFRKAFDAAVTEVAGDYGVFQRAGAAQKKEAAKAVAPKPRKAPPSVKGASAPAAKPEAEKSPYLESKKPGWKDRMAKAIFGQPRQ